MTSFLIISSEILTSVFLSAVLYMPKFSSAIYVYLVQMLQAIKVSIRVLYNVMHRCKSATAHVFQYN